MAHRRYRETLRSTLHIDRQKQKATPPEGNVAFNA
jgi:hypothetical protein